jgi:predicted RNA methylase
VGDQGASEGRSVKIDHEIMGVLSVAEVTGNALKLVGQLDRKLYERANKVLEAAGGKWDRRAKAHLFAGDAAARVDQMLLTGEIVIPKDEFEFFPTPTAVVERLLDLADIKPGMLVMEPSAGKGAIALPVAALGATVDCCELMPQNHAFLLAEKSLRTVVQADFLQVPAEPYYHRVVMNPPFSRQADIKHVQHALRFLKPDGLLVAVMAAGVEFRQDRLANEFRALVEGRGGEIERLGPRR